MADQTLGLTGDMMGELRSFRAQSKFGPEGLYQPPIDAVRQTSAAHIDALLDRLMLGLPQNPTKSFVLGEFKSALEEFELADSEEKDRACTYIETIMDILGIESSDGLLNQWRYGFDHGAKV